MKRAETRSATRCSASARAAAAAALLLLTAARDPILVPEVSQHEVKLQQGFNGTELLLFGALLTPEGTRASASGSGRSAPWLNLNVSLPTGKSRPGAVPVTGAGGPLEAGALLGAGASGGSSVEHALIAPVMVRARANNAAVRRVTRQLCMRPPPPTNQLEPPADAAE